MITNIDLYLLVGKFIVAYESACLEKEYYLASACEEIYAPPSAYFSLLGLTVQASFFRGTLIMLVLAYFSFMILHLLLRRNMSNGL